MFMRSIMMLLVLLAVATGGLQTAAALPAAGTPAADFTLKSNSDRNLRLSELRGQVVLINFWASWCNPCRQELPLLNKMFTQYRAAGLMLLGVNMDDERKNAEAMLKRFDLQFPVLF